MTVLLLLLALSAQAATPPPPDLDLQFAQLAARSRVPVGKLTKVTEALVATRVQRAAAMADQGRFAEALDELSAARKRLVRAQELGADVDPADMDAQVTALRERAIRSHLDAAKTALADGQPGAGLARVQAAMEIGAPDPAELRGRLLAALGAQHLEAGRTLSAARALGQAAALWAEPELVRKATVMNRELADAALARGACRQAAEHYGLVPARAAAAELATATACARTAVEIRLSFDDDSPEGRELLRRVETALRDRVAERASKHLALDGDGPRTVPGPDGPRTTGPIRIEAELRPARLQHGAPSRVVRHAPAQHPLKPGGEWVAVTVAWEELNEAVNAQLEAAVRQTDAGTGETASGLRVVGQGEVQARWAGAVLGYEANDAYSRTVTTVQWGPAGDPVARRSATKARDLARQEATLQAATALGQALADRILANHDSE